MNRLIIDANNVCYSCHYAYKGLTSNKGEATDIIFGMPSMVASIINIIKPDHVTLVWDGKRSAYRLNLMPGYKSHRKTMDEDQRADFNRQKAEVQRIFTALGIPQCHNIDLEADDYIYHLTKRYTERGDRITIVSNDKDFHQLLGSKVKIYAPTKKRYVTHANCRTLFGYGYDQCVDYLCMVGDDSDDIPGIPGVGEKTAKSFLREFTSISNFLKTEGASYPRINRKKLEEVYGVNRQMIDLSWYHKNLLEHRLRVKYLVKKPKYDPATLLKICRKYQIRKFTEPGFMHNFSSLKHTAKT